MNYLSLFSGIGAFEKALDRLQIPYNLVNYCEIDKYASKSYAAVHNVPEELNLGDITEVDTSKLPNIDMISYGFPCQDISLAGRQKGLKLVCDKCETEHKIPENYIKRVKSGEKFYCEECGTELGLTRSGLFFEALRIIEDTKPKIAVAENVKNLTSKKFKEQFDIVLDSLEAAGYNNYWQVLNAKDYGIPQNRERVFIISIRKDIDTGYFKFPQGFKLELRLKDLLEAEVDEKYYINREVSNSFIDKHEIKDIDETEATRIGNYYGDHFNTGYAGNVWNKGGLSPTLMTMQGGGRQPHIVVKENDTKKCHTEASFVNGDICKTVRSGGHGSIDRHSWDMVKCNNSLRIRKLTPLECWRLMGFGDEDFYKAEKVNSNTQLYKQAGNSIVVDVLEYLFKELRECNFF